LFISHGAANAADEVQLAIPNYNGPVHAFRKLRVRTSGDDADAHCSASDGELEWRFGKPGLDRIRKQLGGYSAGVCDFSVKFDSSEEKGPFRSLCF
jgi:hypothetical protein